MKLISLTLILTLSSAFAQTVSPTKPAPKAASAAQPYYKTLKFPPLREVKLPDIAQFTLPNGMRVRIMENHELPLVSGRLIVRTGGLLDPAEKSGLASIYGSVMRAGGTTVHNADQLNALLENMAASVETNMGNESGALSFSCLKENTTEVMNLFKEVLTQPAFAKDKFDLAMTQTRSAISRRNDDPGSVAAREFNNLLYGKDTPYGENEEYETIGKITREDLIAFHKRYFFPANALFIVQGDVNTAELRTQIEKLFADWTPQQPAVPAFPQVTKQNSKGVYVVDKPETEQTFFKIGQLGGKLSDKDYAVLDVMADILGGGFSSRLFQKVRSDNSLAYQIGADWAAQYIHEGTFQVSGSTKASTTLEAINASLKEVKRMREEMVGPTELDAAKQRVLNSFVFNFDSPAKTLNRLVNYEYFGYPKDFINQYKDAVAKVTPQDILRVAKEYLKPEEFSIVAVGKTAEFADKLKELGPVKKLDITIPQPKQETAKADDASLAKGKATLDQITKAVGGSDKLAAVNDYTQTIEAELSMQGNKMTVKQVQMWIKPGIFRQESTYPFGKVIAFFDGNTGFIKAPQGEQPLAGPFAAQVKGQLFRDYFSLLQSNSAAGRTVNFVKDGQLEIKDAAGALVNYFYDVKTMLPARIAFSEGGVTAEVTYSDFMEAGGLKVPGKQSINQMGQTNVQTYKEWKINTGLKAADLSAKQ
jgi:zinc protease